MTDKEYIIEKLATKLNLFSTSGFEKVTRNANIKYNVIESMLKSPSIKAHATEYLERTDPNKAKALKRLVEYRVSKGEKEKDVLRNLLKNIEKKDLQRRRIVDPNYGRVYAHSYRPSGPKLDNRPIDPLKSPNIAPIDKVDDNMLSEMMLGGAAVAAGTGTMLYTKKKSKK